MDGYFIDVSTVNYDNDADFLFKYVDEEKRNKALKYVHNEDRIKTLVGDIIVRIFMCKNYNYQNSEIKYCYNRFQKPFIENTKNINFNVSHSGNLITAAFDDELVGIDVEEIKDIEYEDISKSFFAENEVKWLSEIKKEDRKKSFYKLWTLKESYVKFKGKGLSIPLDSFALNMKDNNGIYKLAGNDEKVFFRSYDIKDIYKLSLCSKKQEGNIKEITYEELVEAANCYLK